MPWPLLEILFALPAYALVLFRFTGLMMTAPVFGSRMIPVRIRVALVFVLAAMVFPSVAGHAPSKISVVSVLVGGFGEMMIGATIGLALTLFVLASEVAGLMVGRQAGIMLGDVFDPTKNEQVSIIGQVYSLTLMILFLLAGGHRATMAALLDTFKVIPLLSFQWNESHVVLLVEMITLAFVLGIRLAGPVLIALFLVGTGLGFLSRTMPQLNILSVGFTVRALVAVGVAGFAIAQCQDILLDAVWEALEAIRLGMGLDPRPIGLSN